MFRGLNVQVVVWGQPGHPSHAASDPSPRVSHRCPRCSLPTVRRNFYIEVPELARMSEEEVEEYRRQLDGVKVGCWPDST